MRAAIRGVGERLFFLPSYSPDLNPIEMVFAKLKTLLRKADERSIQATWQRVGETSSAPSPQTIALPASAMPAMLQSKPDRL